MYDNSYSTINNEDYLAPNIFLLFSLGFISALLFNKRLSNHFFSNDNNLLKPLSCSYVNLFNYNHDVSIDNTDETENVEDDEDDMLIESDDEANSDVDSNNTDDNVNKNIYLISNYDEVMNGCNNPFYKDLNIRYLLCFEKKYKSLSSSFVSSENNETIIEDDDDVDEHTTDTTNNTETLETTDNTDNQENLINITKISNENIVIEEEIITNDMKDTETHTEIPSETETQTPTDTSTDPLELKENYEENNKLLFKFLETDDLNEIYVSHNDPENDKTITLPNNWKIHDEDDEYITFIVNENNISNLFGNLLGLLRCYYAEFETKYQNLNIIYNENSKSPVLFNQANISFKNDTYITYNLLNIRDLYAYTNQQEKILDYDKIDFIQLNEIKDYYNKTIENLTEEDLKSIYKQIY